MLTSLCPSCAATSPSDCTLQRCLWYVCDTTHSNTITEGEAVSFIDAAIVNLRMAERAFNNGKPYGDASKDFVRDPEVFRFIARCFARGYHKGFVDLEKEQSLNRIIRAAST